MIHLVACPSNLGVILDLSSPLIPHLIHQQILLPLPLEYLLNPFILLLHCYDPHPKSVISHSNYFNSFQTNPPCYSGFLLPIHDRTASMIFEKCKSDHVISHLILSNIFLLMLLENTSSFSWKDCVICPFLILSILLAHSAPHLPCSSYTFCSLNTPGLFCLKTLASTEHSNRNTPPRSSNSSLSIIQEAFPDYPNCINCSPLVTPLNVSLLYSFYST